MKNKLLESFISILYIPFSIPPCPLLYVIRACVLYVMVGGMTDGHNNQISSVTFRTLVRIMERGW